MTNVTYIDSRKNNNNVVVSSNWDVFVDVITIFGLGLLMLLVMLSYTKNITYFVIIISGYFIMNNIYAVIYMSLNNDNVIAQSIQHRILLFMSIYNIFLGLFMIVMALTVNKWRMF
jgi:hypothetical protein